MARPAAFTNALYPRANPWVKEVIQLFRERKTLSRNDVMLILGLTRDQARNVFIKLEYWGLIQYRDQNQNIGKRGFKPKLYVWVDLSPYWFKPAPQPAEPAPPPSPVPRTNWFPESL